MPYERRPTIEQVITKALDRRMAEVRVALPARVERYDNSKQVVDARPLIKDQVEQQDGTLAAESWPVIPSVPVVFPGGGGFRLTFPIRVGDTVLLVFSDLSLDNWLTRGGEVDPQDNRTHHLADAIAIPILNPFNAPWTGADPANATIGKDGGLQITLKANEIDLGGVDAFVARADQVLSAISSLVTIFNAHVHPGVTAGGASTAPSATPMTAPGNVGSTSVKVKA